MSVIYRISVYIQWRDHYVIYLARILNIKITAATRTKKNGNFPELKTQQEQQIVVGMYKKSLAPTTIVLSPFQSLFFLISNFVE